jgi:hypothetical protein
VVDQLGSFAGVYFKMPNTTSWAPAAHSFSLKPQYLSGYESYDLIYDAVTVHRNSTKGHVNNWPDKFQDALDKHRTKPNAVQIYSDKENAYAICGLPAQTTAVTTTTNTSVDACPDIVLLRGEASAYIYIYTYYLFVNILHGTVLSHEQSVITQL